MPGFEQNDLILKVTNKHLRRHTRLGKGKSLGKGVNISAFLPSNLD